MSRERTPQKPIDPAAVSSKVQPLQPKVEGDFDFAAKSDEKVETTALANWFAVNIGRIDSIPIEESKVHMLFSM